MYNATNFNLFSSSDVNNLTICGVKVASLVCPSDVQNDSIPIPGVPLFLGRHARLELQPDSLGQSYSPYLSSSSLIPGNWPAGIHELWRQCGDIHLRVLEPDVDLDPVAYFNGVIYNDSSVKIAAITDGTSNTFMFGEHSKGDCFYKLDPGYAVSEIPGIGPLVRQSLCHALSPQHR